MKAWLLTLLLFGLATAQGGRIAFITPSGQVATINPDGSDVTVLTENGVFQFPAWSPDGTTIAAIGSDGVAGGVYLLTDQTAANPNVIYRSAAEAPFYLYWAPDSERLAFLANHPQSGIALHIASADGSSLLAQGSPFYWQWTANAQSLLIHSGFSGPGARLGFTSRVRDTLGDNLAEPGRFQPPGISGSERFIAFAELQGERSTLIVQNNPGINSESIRRELRHDGLVALTFSPQQDLLAFIYPEIPAPHFFGPLNLLDAETGNLERLSDRTVLAFFWSPDGRYIAYLTPAPAPGGGGVARIDTQQHIAARDAQAVTPLQAQPIELDLLIVDTTTLEQQFIASFIPSPLWLQQFLPFFDQYALSHRVWSPGSDALTFPVVDFDTLSVQVAVFNLNGDMQLLTAGDTPFWNTVSD
jgi:TolB protein